MNDRLACHFKTHPTIDIPAAEVLGVSRAMLSYLVKAGALRRIARGAYAPASAVDDELVAIATRSPNIVFSHETALVLHKLHNRIPALPSVTISTGKRVPHSIENAVSVYHVKPELHGLGLTRANSFMGNAVPCYDQERTICDIIRSYARIDEETYVSALRNYAAKRDRNLPLLFDYARTMGIEKKVHKALEVLL